MDSIKNAAGGVRKGLIVRMRGDYLVAGIAYAVLFGAAYLLGAQPSFWNDPSFPYDERTSWLIAMWGATFGWMFLMSLYLIWAWFRDSVEIGPEGIVHSGIWTRHALTWSEITHVESDDRGRLRLEGTRGLVLAGHAYTKAARRMIALAICEHVAVLRGKEMAGWSTPRARKPSPPLGVWQTLGIGAIFGLPGAAMIAWSFVGGTTKDSIWGMALVLLSATVWTWAAIRMRSIKVAGTALLAWSVFGAGVCKVMPMFRGE